MEAERHIHFVTGKLAATALRETVAQIAAQQGFAYSIDILPISVAALMTPDWIARHIRVPEATTEIMLPGYCEGAFEQLADKLGRPVRLGPRDLHELPAHYGQASRRDNYGEYSIEIIAEINHVPKLTLEETLACAAKLHDDGADVIDVGCTPGQPFTQVAEYVRALCDQGHRVSIDSFDVDEIAAATAAGAELVLSVNASNRHAAVDWGCEVVAIPDEIATLGGLEATVAALHNNNVPFRLDPILEPIGCGFAESLGRYLHVRKQFPDQPMMMGIGNLTELTDADSAGINVLLLGFCQEQSIHSILTTQVIPWAATSVKECDLARRLVHHAMEHQTIPKHLEPKLVVLRDAHQVPSQTESLTQLANELKDGNFRLFADEHALHIVSTQLHLSDTDPFRLFDRLLEARPDALDAGHAFYLGYELAKANTARTLGKTYRQDEALDWGYLTQTEDFHRIRRRWRRARPSDA